MKYWKLLRTGCVTALIYLLQLLFYGTPFNPQFAPEPFLEIFSWTAALCLLALYWSGYREVVRISGGKAVLGVIVGFALIFAAIGAVTFPFHSTDVFVYVANGWEQSHYGLNPYAHHLRDISGVETDAMIANPWISRSINPWMDQPFTYGFAFALFCRLLAKLGQGNWAFTVLLFQAANFGIYSATIWLLWRLVVKLQHPNPQSLVYLYAWSPLVLIHLVTNAHNDVLIGALLLAAAWAVIAGTFFWIIPLLVLAGLIKYVGFMLLPFALIHVIKHKGWATGAFSLAAGALITAAVALPYLFGAEAFQPGAMLSQMTNTKDSLYAFLFYSYRSLTRLVPILAGSLDAFGNGVKLLLWLGFIILCAFRFWSYIRRVSPDSAFAIGEWALLLSVLIGIVSSQFYAWYIGMVFPLLLLLPAAHWLWRAGVIASSLHVLSLTSLMRKGIGYFAFTTLPAVVAARLSATQEARAKKAIVITILMMIITIRT